MAKEFLDELIEALEELKKTEAERVYAAVENREFPPMIFTPATVMRTVNAVIQNHKLTAEELGMSFAGRDITPSEFELMTQLESDQTE